MIEIGLNKVTKNYGFNNILNNISLDIKTNERVALIGSNGCGKTTILKIIAGIENINSGMISIRKDATIGMLNQITEECSNDIKVKEVLYKGLNVIISLQEKLNRYENKLSKVSGEELNKTIEIYTRLQQEFISLGGYEIDAKIYKVLDIFKINTEMLERYFNTLSGGEKTIISLAKLILSEPDILLLDEPTNHLDIDTIEWLEQFLNNYKGTVLFVSHDRYFLDKVANKIVLIERENLEIFNGNYSSFLVENENRMMLEFKDYKNQQKQIQAMKDAINKLREWGKIGDNEIFFKRATSIEKRLEKMELVNSPLKKQNIPLAFSSENRSGKDVIDIKNLNVSFNEKKIFVNTSFQLFYGEKVCIMGKNGSGKSTLIKEILNNQNASIKIGSSVLIGYIPQEISFDNDNLTIIDEAKKYFIGNDTYLRAALCKFLFIKDNVFKKLKLLSGGEKVRLKLFCLIQQQYNLLILDEPTNQIDIDTKEILENALQDYKATLLFISHDRYFINKLATRIVNIENNKLLSYVGNYDDYRKHK